MGSHHLEVVRGGVAAALIWPEGFSQPALARDILARARAGTVAIIGVGTDEQLGAAPWQSAELSAADLVLICLPASRARFLAELDSALAHLTVRRDRARLAVSLEHERHKADLLISVGRSLSQERDISSLLEHILQRAREVTRADAGSVYVVEGEADTPEGQRLRFTASQNDSIAVASEGFTMAVSPSSIVGACVLGREIINITDLYHLDPPGNGNNRWGFVHDRSFDEKHHYQTRSILTVPMISARDEVIGVIQLINRRRAGVLTLASADDFAHNVITFDDESENYAAALSSQAGIALENALLYDEVKTLFEGFVHASVTAIESRDPTTSGHSERVARLTVGFARAADSAGGPALAPLSFTEDELKQIEFAALLHDFGKVGVRERVLVKANKLYEHDRALVLARFDFIRRTVEADASRDKIRYLLEQSREQAAEKLAAIDRDTEAKLRELDDFVAFILKANQPTVLEQGGFERIAEIAQRTFIDTSGAHRPYLTPEEATALQIGRGSLTVAEREEIQSHVTHTFNFLSQIPWSRTFRNVPIIAGAHHEKLDGSGYPRGLLAADIPAPARMMTISDIYDALTASDRPYKRAVPEDRALDIIRSEVDRGLLDADLFELFVDAEIYHLVRPRENA